MATAPPEKCFLCNSNAISKKNIKNEIYYCCSNEICRDPDSKFTTYLGKIIDGKFVGLSKKQLNYMAIKRKKPQVDSNSENEIEEMAPQKKIKDLTDTDELKQRLIICTQTIEACTKAIILYDKYLSALFKKIVFNEDNNISDFIKDVDDINNNFNKD